MSPESLIKEIGILRASQDWTPAYLQAIDDCLKIIRRHLAEPSQAMVERVASAIAAVTGDDPHHELFQKEARAAIAAMQEAL